MEDFQAEVGTQAGDDKVDRGEGEREGESKLCPRYNHMHTYVSNQSAYGNTSKVRNTQSTSRPPERRGTAGNSISLNSVSASTQCHDSAVQCSLMSVISQRVSASKSSPPGATSTTFFMAFVFTPGIMSPTAVTSTFRGGIHSESKCQGSREQQD